jgi:hypothetical protein
VPSTFDLALSRGSNRFAAISVQRQPRREFGRHMSNVFPVPEAPEVDSSDPEGAKYYEEEHERLVRRSAARLDGGLQQEGISTGHNVAELARQYSGDDRAASSPASQRDNSTGAVTIRSIRVYWHRSHETGTCTGDHYGPFRN